MISNVLQYKMHRCRRHFTSDLALAALVVCPRLFAPDHKTRWPLVKSPHFCQLEATPHHAPEAGVFTMAFRLLPQKPSWLGGSNCRGHGRPPSPGCRDPRPDPPDDRIQEPLLKIGSISSSLTSSTHICRDSHDEQPEQSADDQQRGRQTRDHLRSPTATQHNGAVTELIKNKGGGTCLGVGITCTWCAKETTRPGTAERDQPDQPSAPFFCSRPRRSATSSPCGGDERGKARGPSAGTPAAGDPARKSGDHRAVPRPFLHLLARSTALNEVLERGAVAGILAPSPSRRITWQCDPGTTRSWRGRWKSSASPCFDRAQTGLSLNGELKFVDRMYLVYRAVDLVVGSAGATTSSELLITGTPSLLIPSPNVA
ncbi:hypothetical protein KFL_009630010 [Klebsormidium nitens]|uniref:Glycosyl transferase family 28 C-terminal domain-containing protein n=1 Tax=Klebsormidium nitens TaxID=105231 RepID=A0A1Y1INN3_KLENI|nr:hypothetical protein KFL_009630010 [Klebsormidium nitens]|eukprot:GAQ92273.1 hypothetical protein KFL_009630010 [Klebsormidium nitens]